MLQMKGLLEVAREEKGHQMDLNECATILWKIGLGIKPHVQNLKRNWK